MDAAGDLLTWTLDWSSLTTTAISGGGGDLWPSDPSGIAMTYSYPGGP
jgi:hypothetical protein